MPHAGPASISMRAAPVICTPPFPHRHSAISRRQQMPRSAAPLLRRQRSRMYATRTMSRGRRRQRSGTVIAQATGHQLPLGRWIAFSAGAPARCSRRRVDRPIDRSSRLSATADNRYRKSARAKSSTRRRYREILRRAYQDGAAHIALIDDGDMPKIATCALRAARDDFRPSRHDI